MIRLPIGIDDFKELIQKGYHFIDKSLFIKDIINDDPKVTLITRPRRFGKTINMSMLYYYFTNDPAEIDAKLFDLLLINQHQDITKEHYHKYSTIFITFKDAKAINYEDTIAMVAHLMGKTYQKYKSEELFEVLTPNECDYFDRIVNKQATITELKTSLVELIEYLHRLYNQDVIVLIDEYDTPVHAAYTIIIMMHLSIFSKLF